MIATSHVIIGGAAGLATGIITQNPAAALAVGVISHFICDSLPHLDTPPNAKFIGDDIVWDRKLYVFAITDSLIAFFVTLAIWYFRFNLDFSSVFAWGAFGGYLPDLIDNFPLWNRGLHETAGFKQFHSLHLWIHNNWKTKFPMPQYWLLGIFTQIILVIPSLWWILHQR